MLRGIGLWLDSLHRVEDGTSMAWLRRWREQVADLRREVAALYLAVRDERCPWYTRTVVAVVIAYALSPLT